LQAPGEQQGMDPCLTQISTPVRLTGGFAVRSSTARGVGLILELAWIIKRNPFHFFHDQLGDVHARNQQQTGGTKVNDFQGQSTLKPGVP